MKLSNLNNDEFNNAVGSWKKSHWLVIYKFDNVTHFGLLLKECITNVDCFNDGKIVAYDFKEDL